MELLERLRLYIRDAFDISGTTPHFRKSLFERASALLVSITEPKLKAFGLRLIDSNLSDFTIHRYVRLVNNLCIMLSVVPE